MVLDDRKVSITRTHDKGLKKLQEDKDQLREKLKAKKKDLETLSRVIYGLNQLLGDAQSEVTRQRSKLEELRKKLANVEAGKKNELVGRGGAERV